jgi:hypothetical protein
MIDESRAESTVGGGQQAVELTADEMMAQCVAVESEGRRWLKGITSFVATRSRDADPSSAVQTAADMAYIAAFDRIARIMRSDQPVDW